MRIGVTGHQRLEDAAAWGWVREEIRAALRELPGPHTGLTSLAAGADQLFAEVVLEAGGGLHVVLPFEGYERKLAGGALARYERLLRRADEVEVLDGRADDAEAAYLAAGKRVVDAAERVVAVWNGRPAAGIGGTGDVVAYANSRGTPVIHLDPIARVRADRVAPLSG
jgi:hypothetical protein